MFKFKKVAIISLVFIMIILSAACDITGRPENESTTMQTGSEKELKVSDFFPVEEDLYLKYKGIGNEYAEFETYVEYIDKNLLQQRNYNPGTVSVMIYEVNSDELKRVFFEGEIYYRKNFIGSINTEDILIKAPIIEGTSWILNDGSKRKITAIEKDINTAAGTFKALEVTTELEHSTTIDYYAKGLGLVKRVFNSKEGDFEVISELESVERNKSLTERVMLFYPDFDKGISVFIRSDFNLKTNEDIVGLIEENLKTPPEGLSETFTENTVIMKVEVIPFEMVTVDLSSDFIKEMNAGSSLESLLIESIANTFGAYYQSAAVKITIDGKPYESGHFLFAEDEYIEVDMESFVEHSTN